MDAAWINPLISAAAGVGGAALGAGALLRVNHRDLIDRREAEHRAALVGVWTAANSLGMLYASYGATMPKSDHWLARARHGIQISAYAKNIIERLLEATDRVWEAGGRLRTVANAEELEALNEIETVFGDWEIGEPLPVAWGPAIQRLGRLLEAPSQ